MLDHKHMLGKAFLRNPPRTVEIANEWLTKLVDLIDMKILMGPYSIDCQTLGNEGVTGVVVIETSHASFHCWHAVEKPFLMFDVYSCVDFDPETVRAHIHEYFDIEWIDYGVFDRNDGVKQIAAYEGR